MAQDNDGDITRREILLVANILVRGKQDFKSGALGGLQQFTVT
jgi:hypothetical protein